MNVDENVALKVHEESSNRKCGLKPFQQMGNASALEISRPDADWQHLKASGDTRPFRMPEPITSSPWLLSSSCGKKGLLWRWIRSFFPQSPPPMLSAPNILTDVHSTPSANPVEAATGEIILNRVFNTCSGTIYLRIGAESI